VQSLTNFIKAISWKTAATLGILGTAAVAAGAFLDGYDQAVVLQLGSALLLIAPILLAERALDRRVDDVRQSVDVVQKSVDEVEDRFVEGLEDAASERVRASSQGDLFEQVVDTLTVASAEAGWSVEQIQADSRSLSVVDFNGTRVSVVVVESPLPVSRRTMDELQYDTEDPQVVVAARGFTKAALSVSSGGTWVPASDGALEDLPPFVASLFPPRTQGAHTAG